VSVQDYRVDERRRQRERRERQAAAATASAGCHAPASASNPAELMEKVLESWDGAVAMSRASLQRRFGMILRRSMVKSGTEIPPTTVLSRAGLGP
jgi:hypothetical protein